MGLQEAPQYQHCCRFVHGAPVTRRLQSRITQKPFGLQAGKRLIHTVYRQRCYLTQSPDEALNPLRLWTLFASGTIRNADHNCFDLPIPGSFKHRPDIVGQSCPLQHTGGQSSTQLNDARGQADPPLADVQGQKSHPYTKP